MNTKNKLVDMPIQPLLYTMAVPLMLSLLVQSLYNIVDSMFVAKLSETALTAASLVYSIQFLMISGFEHNSLHDRPRFNLGVIVFGSSPDSSPGWPI